MSHPNLDSGRIRRLHGPNGLFQGKLLGKIGQAAAQAIAQKAADFAIKKMIDGEPDQDSIENAEESMSPRQRRTMYNFARHLANLAVKQFGEADERSED